MAEVADILSKPDQISILPDLSAGCSMADMANRSKVERVWHELSEILDPDEAITPSTYINSAADLKYVLLESMVVLSAHPVTLLKFLNGLFHVVKRYYFFLINILDVGVDTNLEFPIG